MSAHLPQDLLDLVTTKQTFGHLATRNADGSLQSTPVWVDWDGTHVIVNTARGRRKDRNMHERPEVAISIVDPDNPYRYLEIRGRIEDETETGAWEHIHRMARKYLGQDRYPFAKEGSETRVLYKIKPRSWSAMRP